MSTRVEMVTLALREMLLNGAFQPGERVPEVAVAKKLGVSRTPVRLALGVLENEGLVVGEPNRGFTVREITLSDIMDGFDVRGALEGLACRIAAERGLDGIHLDTFDQCLTLGAALLSPGSFDAAALRQWSEMNALFHGVILEAADSKPLEAALETNSRLPLVSAGAIAFSNDDLDLAYRMMEQAQDEHEQIVDAMRLGQGARAEHLAREHAYRSRINLRHALENRPGATQSIPGLRLVS